jgi:hypothetical protein
LIGRLTWLHDRICSAAIVLLGNYQQNETMAAVVPGLSFM